jgi:hypothetical protein
MPYPIEPLSGFYRFALRPPLTTKTQRLIDNAFANITESAEVQKIISAVANNGNQATQAAGTGSSNCAGLFLGLVADTFSMVKSEAVFATFVKEYQELWLFTHDCALRLQVPAIAAAILGCIQKTTVLQISALQTYFSSNEGAEDTGIVIKLIGQETVLPLINFGRVSAKFLSFPTRKGFSKMISTDLRQEIRKNTTT